MVLCRFSDREQTYFKEPTLDYLVIFKLTLGMSVNACLSQCATDWQPVVVACRCGSGPMTTGIGSNPFLQP